jgi:hypothetical protein
VEKPVPHGIEFLVDGIVPMVLSGAQKPAGLPSLAGSVAERLLQCKASPRKGERFQSTKVELMWVTTEAERDGYTAYPIAR